MNRREFLSATAAAAASLTAAEAQSPPPSWPNPTRDIHLHLRRDLDGNAVHCKGAGVSNAILLAPASAAGHVKAIQDKYPGMFVWAASADITKPEAEQVLTSAVKSGALGFGEIKFNVACDGPELRRMYALAAELGVPILIHFQEYPHFAGETNYSTGIQTRLEPMLKAYPKTKFVGHCDAFWANLSADYQNQSAYPSGPIQRGGVTDKLLSDYPNLFGDMSANSGNNGLSRDPEFTKGFLQRHQDKLMFGSDCSCSDGNGGGTSQANNPAAARLAGKCVARETLAVLKRSSTPAIFRKLTWENAQRIYQIPS